SQEIEAALKESDFLIVVCSPRTPESEWVNKEVVRFRDLGRGDRILALLIEGEPGQSFPRSLREIRYTGTDEEGSHRQQFEEIEPLAADVRATGAESLRQLRRLAKLRIASRLLGCRFDELRQRDQERRHRQLRAIVLALGLLSACMLGLTSYALF